MPDARRGSYAHCHKQVADLASSGEMLLATASSRGAVCLARLLLPRFPGASPADIQILELPSEEQRLTPWAEVHKGAVASVDIHPETKLVLTAGIDGGLCIMDPAGSETPTTKTASFKPACPRGYTSFANARWTNSQTVVAVGPHFLRLKLRLNLCPFSFDTLLVRRQALLVWWQCMTRDRRRVRRRCKRGCRKWIRCLPRTAYDGLTSTPRAPTCARWGAGRVLL